MSVGRRGLITSVTFLGLALWLCPDRRATAQPGHPLPNDSNTGRHSLWKQELSPDQIRDTLAKFGQGGQGKDEPLEQLLRRAIKDKNQNATDEQVDAMVKRFLNDKGFRDRVMDLAQKQKNQMPDNGNGGPPPKISREDLEKLVKLFPDGGNGGVEQPGIKGDPNRLPPFNPNNPQFDPQRFPKIDPNNPPQFDPDTGFPLGPNGRPFDPRNGRPINPNNPPQIAPPQPMGQPPAPKFEPPQPPANDPNAGRPPEQPNNDGKRKFDPDNPLGAPADEPDKVAKTKAVEAATALWEKNVGPIDDSPDVKRAILELVSDPDAMEALTDNKGRNIFEALENDGDDKDKFGNLFGNGGGQDAGWEWPKFDFPWSRGRDLDLDLDSKRTRTPDTPTTRDYSSSRRSSSGDSSGTLDLGGLKFPFLFLLFLMALLTGAFIWWKWAALIRPRAAAAGVAGPSPWPIDPRAINSREDLVRAFEYLSVLICGPGAKMWTHSTIADELSALAETHGETAVKLARLYELARYAPLDEPLTRVELMESRRLVCDLAGMDYA